MQVRVLFPVVFTNPKHNEIMDELKQRLMEKIGLDEEKSQNTIEIVVNFIKEQLPENLQGMVDGLISGKGGDNPLDAVKGLFGGD